MTTENVKKELKKAANSEKKAVLERFFKTGPGQYGEGDLFLGVTVPKQRSIAKKYQDFPLEEVRTLLQSPVHEHRLTALLILTYRFPTVTVQEQKTIFSFYIANTDQINNWDLVDVTAPNIVGEYLVDRPKTILRRMARSTSLWERRIAIVSTFAFIRRGKAENTLDIATILLHDPHDLIHKAVGWMLREVGKRCGENILTEFLDQHAATMPRTMLRYALERLSKEKREKYMQR